MISRALRGRRWRGAPWLRPWAQDSATLAGAQFAALAVTTLLTVIVARHLGLREFGIFAGFLGLSQVVMFFAAFGVATWLLRELSGQFASTPTRDQSYEQRMLSASLLLTGGSAALLTLVSLALTMVIGASADLALAVGALMAYVGMLTVATVSETVFRAHRRLRPIVAAMLLEKSALGISIVLAVTIASGISGIALAYLVAGAVRIAWNVVAFRRAGLIALVGPTRADVAKVLRSSLPFGLGTAMPGAIVRLDVFLIALISASSAGLYAVADRFIGVLLVIPSACAAALYPHLARQRDAVSASWRAAVVLGAVGAILATAGVLLAPAAVGVLFGDGYRDAVDVVRVILVATPLLYAVSIVMAGLFSAGQDRIVVAVIVVGTIGGTGMVVGGQALFGAEGAAAGYVARYAVLLLGLGALSWVVHAGRVRDSSLDASDPGPPVAVEARAGLLGELPAEVPPRV